MDNKDLNQIDKTIEEMKEKQKFSLMEKKKTLNEIHLDEEENLKQEDIEREQFLNQEIKRINQMIKNSNPKWILDDFDEFVYKKFDEKRNKKIIEIKIANKKSAIELMTIFSKLKNNKNNEKNNKNNFIKIIWDKDILYKVYSKELNEEKVLQLLKGWVFYANTQVDYDKLKFAKHKSKKGNIIDGILGGIIVIVIPIMIFIGVICLIS